MPDDTRDVTALLRSWAAGDQDALEQLTPIVYAQLRAQARRCMRRERPGLTLESTALVHEAYLKLMTGPDIAWRDRVHFFALAARIMRRILIDAARARRARKRGGGERPAERSPGVDLENLSTSEASARSLCALDDALETLAKMDERRARVIELRFFGGMSVEETAAALDVSAQTVMRDWRLARAWLARELRSGETTGP
jgi:RNA polymerase sigma factor (TIGR02999 family)